MDFTNVTDQQLENLARSCDPATFGVATKDILDESYRKAGKMDTDRFATHFSPTDLGILEFISDFLLRERVPEKSIRLELYKLNIYGKYLTSTRLALVTLLTTLTGPGGFFKAHVDTPRSDTMFASLVVVLPTVHDGGSLIIRHNGKEWTFDSSKAVNSEPTPHAAFVAFFSDVEHEVMPVSSGYRVTLTYNLYLKKKTTANRPAGFGHTFVEIKNALDSLLRNPELLPDGGILGFGFAHKYPFSQASTKLSDVEGRLKGTDAAIKLACDSLSLSTAVKAVYSGDDPVLLDHFVDFGDQEIESDMAEYLKQYDNGLVVYDFGEEQPSYGFDDLAKPIIWVKALAKTNPFSSSYLHYGNEASLACVYGEVCLVATVPSAKDRGI